MSSETLRNVGITALVSALTLTTADGVVARTIVSQLERAAIARLGVEAALSATALAAGGRAELERDILQTWTDYYLGALDAAKDIETGGSSPATLATITAARERVRTEGARRVAAIR